MTILKVPFLLFFGRLDLYLPFYFSKADARRWRLRVVNACDFLFYQLIDLGIIYTFLFEQISHAICPVISFMNVKCVYLIVCQLLTSLGCA